MLMFQFVLVSIFHLAIGLVQKETALNAQITSQNGASIEYNNDHVTLSGTNYNITLQSEDNDIGYDLKLSLNKSWSFHKSISSSIILTLNGITPHPDKDTDFLLVFSVNDWQYFSFFVHLDYTNNIKSHIYPSISMQNISTSVSDWISNNEIQSRWDRISNNGTWLKIPGWNKQVLWPLKFIITNNPINNEIILQLYHNTSQTYATGYTFENSIFIPNKPIDVYLMGDSVGEQMTISSVNIQLNHNETATNNSTINPIINPTDLIADELEMDYGITLIIGFKYTFSVIDVNTITRIIQNFIILTDDNCEERIKQTVTTKPNITIINATIYLCDPYTQNELLIAANDGILQTDIIGNINREIQHLEIIANKTWLEANSINGIPFPNSTQTINNTVYNMNKILTNNKKSFADYYSFWMIIFIAIPIIACCSFLSYLRMSVNRKEKKDKSETEQHINLNISPGIVQQHISKIKEESDNELPMRKNSSKLYKIRQYNQPKTNSVASVSIPITNKSNNSNAQSNVLSTSPISPRLYKTRGVSEDIYDDNATTNGEISHDEMYNDNKVVLPLDNEKLSQTVVTMQQSPIYKLPNDQITKRQWL